MDAKLMLKVAFTCMACDGKIAKEEVDLLFDIVNKYKLLKNIDVKTEITKLVNSLNESPKNFFSSFFVELKNSVLSIEEELELVRISIDIIEADNNIDYKEIKFFKTIRSYFHVTDEVILETFPNKEDYLATDIKRPDYLKEFIDLIDDYKIDLKDLKITNR